MKKGRMLALVSAMSVAMGAFGLQALASREGTPSQLPVLLKHGPVYITKESRNRLAGSVADDAGRSLYILQFTGPVKEAYKSALVRLGVELGDYLPENAFLVRMTGTQLAQVQNLGFVKGAVAYQPAMKLDRGLSRLGKESLATVRITTFKEGTKGPVAALSTLGLKPEAIGIGAMTAQVDGSRLQGLLNSTDVVYVEPVLQNQLLNDKAAGIMGVNSVWGAGLDGKGQIVAVTDTGLDTGKLDSSMHPDFQGQVKKLYALGKPGDASDLLAHGTHVAGSVLGTGAASKGQFKGMAPGAKLVFQSVEDKQGGLGGIPEDLTQLFRQAYADGARIHTNSWGVPATQGGTVYDAQSAQVDRFMWEHPDYTILFAAGNDGDNDRNGVTDYGTVSTPGTAKNAITVGASQNNRPGKKQGDDVRAMASFSSRGPTGDGRVKPDVVAPGTWIASTRSSLSDDKHFWAPHESNNRYGYMGGTSMATPLTAGGTALVRQYYVEKLGVTPMASLLKATLVNGAAQMGQGVTWKDTGWGRVDIKNSLYGRPFKFVNEEKALTTGDGVSYSYQVKAGQPLKVTLAWTDYPANPSADKTLVNDLDLTVKGPDGKEIPGNQMIAAGADRTNNVENVTVTAPKDGTYTVTVKGYNVPQGPQKFGMVVSGNVDAGTSQPTPPPQNPDPAPNPPAAADKVKPTVAITTPAAGAKVSGTVTIASDARDNVGVARVVAFVDGQEVGSVTTAPFNVTWDSGKVSNGTHTLVTRAYDAAGNAGVSAPVTVTVANTAAAGSQTLTFGGKLGAYRTGQRFYIDVKPGTVTAELTLAGSGAASISAFDPLGRAVAQGKGSLTFKAATAGTYSIMVTSLGGVADYTLRANFPPADGTAVISKSGKLSAVGQRYQIHPIQVKRTGSINASVDFAGGKADLDLYVVDGLGRIVASGTTPNLDPETVSIAVAPGTYYLYVVADSGQSDYQLTAYAPQ